MNQIPALKESGKARLYLFVSACLIISFVLKIALRLYSLYKDGEVECLNSFEYTEFLINFQGGFVRRGLLGELLYQAYTIVDYPLIPTLTIACYLVFFYIVYFFFRKFHEKKYCWWILLSPLMLGFSYYAVRKDFLLYLILIVCLYCLRYVNSTIRARILACALIVLGLFLHEVFIFFGFPIYALLLLYNKNHKVLNWILTLVPIVIFMVFCIFKGNMDSAHHIIDSWNSVLPDEPLAYRMRNSIGALGWNTHDTFLLQLKRNINYEEGGYGIILLPAYIMMAYYLFTNFLSVFQTNFSREESESIRLTLSLLYSFAIICLFPMFTVLSCDNGRVFQYASIATFAAFLIVPHNTIIKAFPIWYQKMVVRLNSGINRYLPPSKGLLMLLLLFVGMSNCYFSLQTCWENSVIGSIWDYIFQKICRVGVCLIH